MTDEQPDEDSIAHPDDLEPIALLGEAGPEAVIELSGMNWSDETLDRLTSDLFRRVHQRRAQMQEAVEEARREQEAAENKLIMAQLDRDHFEKIFKAFFL